MKILAISDEVSDLLYSTRIKDHYSDVDLILGCGDLPFYYLEFIVTMLDAPLYYVPGNHDKPQQYLSDGRIITHAEGCVDLDARVMEEAPLLLAGLGGCLRYNAEGRHQYSQAEMRQRARQLAPRLWLNRLRHGRWLDILVTHAPPRGIHDDTDLAHTGFEAFLPFMDFYQPRFLLHGHAHVYRSDAITRTRYKQTEVINVYPYRLIEWEA